MVMVSVIMPVYNGEDYLKESVDCILNQTLGDLELICVDDGSTDSSLEILNEIASNDSRVKVMSQSNRGGGAARNSALKHATGKYLYFMDADDMLDLNAFDEFYQIAEEKNIDFLIFKAQNYAEDTGEIYETDYYSMSKIAEFSKGKVFSPDDLGELIFNISVTPWCKFYNRKFVEKSGARFLENSIFHDNQFFWEVLFNAKRMYFIDKSYYTRRRHSASSTGAGDERYINIINVVNNIIKLFEKYSKLEQFKKTLYNKKVFWTSTRYFEIRDEFKPMFYDELKKDYENVPEDFRDCLEAKNKYIFDAVVNSKTMREFDLMMINYELRCENTELKNKKKIKNFAKYRVKKLIGAVNFLGPE